jgi:hypothetical protein
MRGSERTSAKKNSVRAERAELLTPAAYAPLMLVQLVHAFSLALLLRRQVTA